MNKMLTSFLAVELNWMSRFTMTTSYGVLRNPNNSRSKIRGLDTHGGAEEDEEGKNVEETQGKADRFSHLFASCYSNRVCHG
jgi:hypothetical protein